MRFKKYWLSLISHQLTPLREPLSKERLPRPEWVLFQPGSRPNQPLQIAFLQPLALASRECQELSSLTLTPAAWAPHPLQQSLLPHPRGGFLVFFITVFLNCTFHKTVRKKSGNEVSRKREAENRGPGGKGGEQESSLSLSRPVPRTPSPGAILALDASHPLG